MAEHPPTLDLHFIGGSEGESIVIRFPDGQWAVVDAYSRNLKNPAANLTVAFLREKDVTELAFVCLTHPHEDHYCGLRQVLEHPQWRVRAIWRPAALPQQVFNDWAKQILKWREKEGTARERAEISELTTLFRHVTNRNDIKKSRLQIDINDPPLKRCFPGPDDPDPTPGYEVLLFAPPGGQLGIYEDEINRAMGRPDPKKLYNLANDISVGLIIRYGATCVVLSGDITNSAWDEVDSRIPDTTRPLHVLKVPHHGSTTGYTEVRWRRYCSRHHTTAVVFPFHRHGLPTADSCSFFDRETASVKYTVHPVPNRNRGSGEPGPTDHASLLVSAEFQARSVPFASGRWSLSLAADGSIQATEAEGDATESPV